MMTALAMIMGMLPMALGLGEGGEQNAPLGRAVIGGLLLATVATLFFVPVVYSVLRRKPPTFLEHEAEVEEYDDDVSEVDRTAGRQRHRSPARLLVFFALLAMLVAAAIVGGLLPRLARQKALMAASETRRSSGRW